MPSTLTANSLDTPTMKVKGLTPYQLVKMHQFKDGTYKAFASAALMGSVGTEIPKITQGEELMRLVVTPDAPSGILIVSFKAHVESNTTPHVMAGLFKLGTTDAIASTLQTTSGNTFTATIHLTDIQIPFTDQTPITLIVRAGVNAAATLNMNGYNGALKGGGNLFSNITAMEYTR